MGVFKFSRVDFAFTLLGLGFLLLDVGLDVAAAVSLYWAQDFGSLAVLLLLLLGSSLLVQVYSWLFYSYDGLVRITKVESWPTTRLLKLLHVLQMGIYLRHASVVESYTTGFVTRVADSEGCGVYLTHDLSLLRQVETFTESAPQLVLMLTIMLQRGQLDAIAVLKAVGSAAAVAFSVTMYHRMLRSFLVDREKQNFLSSLVYFLWNLLLIAARVTALALFASVLPCFIFTHFVCSWLLLFLAAFRSRTDFMDSAGGEWLYRATVGVFWYFNWFNVAAGPTLLRTMLYHTYVLLDVLLLCGVWCWKMHTDPPEFSVSPQHAIAVAACVTGVYVLGLLLKLLYYKRFHPNVTKERLKGGQAGVCSLKAAVADVTDAIPAMMVAMDRRFDAAMSPDIRVYNKRTQKLAENFYS